MSLDLEKQVHTSAVSLQSDTGVGEVDITAAGPEWKQKINSLLLRFNAETRGIERVPEEEQTDGNLLHAGSMWFGCNMVVATFALGALGITVFGLSFWTAFLCIVFFNILGSQTVALFSTFGPYFGLRQMPFTRFWFGWYGVRLCTLISLITCVGWSAINVIVSAQLLHIVNNQALPEWAGVFIVTLLSLAITLFGFKTLHLFEKWSWVPTVIIFLIIAVRMGKSHTFTAGTMGSGATEAGNVLSFGATIYGYATGWTSMASDYTVYMKKSTSRFGIYWSVVVGLNIPLIMAMTLGAACATGTLTSEYFAAQYKDNSIGGLFYAILVKDSLHGFGEFCIVMLALSTVSNNIPNLYSFSLSIQTLWTQFAKVPRVIWNTVGACASLAISIPGYMFFEQVIHNFMNMTGYWLAIYSAVGLSEHYIYRRGFKGYNPDDYATPSALPLGISAIIAFCVGVVGAVLGMNQIWWQGPVAKKIGLYAGDVGFELAFAFALVTYNACRPFELKRFGR